MDIKVILFGIVSIFSSRNMTAQNKGDTAKNERLDVGYKIILPIYPECADGIPSRPDYAYACDMFLKSKSAIDSFVWLVEVHSDCRSSYLYNSMFTQRKADSIVAYLKRKSNDSIRVTGIGMGESQLVNDCTCEGKVRVPCTETQHQENRRMVFRIIGRREF